MPFITIVDRTTVVSVLLFNTATEESEESANVQVKSQLSIVTDRLQLMLYDDVISREIRGERERCTHTPRYTMRAMSASSMVEETVKRVTMWVGR